MHEAFTHCHKYQMIYNPHIEGPNRYGLQLSCTFKLSFILHVHRSVISRPSTVEEMTSICVRIYDVNYMFAYRRTKFSR